MRPRWALAGPRPSVRGHGTRVCEALKLQGKERRGRTWSVAWMSAPWLSSSSRASGERELRHVATRWMTGVPSCAQHVSSVCLVREVSQHARRHAALRKAAGTHRVAGVGVGAALLQQQAHHAHAPALHRQRQRPQPRLHTSASDKEQGPRSTRLGAHGMHSTRLPLLQATQSRRVSVG